MRVFISYGKKDSFDFAEGLAKWLEEQGFEPWLDRKDGISPGEPFDIRIEQGISNSQLLIALISPWSVRQESYCRNEWLYAQYLDKPIIPIRLADINPPLVIINLHYEDEFNDPEKIFKKLLPVLKEVQETGKPRYRDWMQQEDGKQWWARREKLNFEKELIKYGDSFIGRRWLFKKLEKWVADGKTQMAFITADTGLGKSAIAAQLVTKLNVRSVHFCLSSNIKTCEPEEWIRELIYQLAAQFDVYRQKIENPSNEPKKGASAEHIFTTLIVEPLSEIENEINPEEPWVFVIDSLDESLSTAGDAMVKFLSEKVVNNLPPWIKIITTSRPDKSIISRFSIEGVEHLVIKASDNNNITDVFDYVEKRLNNLVPDNKLQETTNIVEQIAAAANGNFQYIKVLLDNLEIDRDLFDLSHDKISRFPKNLSGLYDRIFRNRFKDLDNYYNNLIPIINCLIASKEPLDKQILIKSSNLDNQHIGKGLLALSQFLNDTESGYRFFHQSIMDWLSDINLSADFFASREEGQQMLAKYCFNDYLKDYSRMSTYSKKYIAIHLAESEQWEELLMVIEDTRLGFLKQWTEGIRSNIGVICLEGAISYLSSGNKNKILLAGIATQLARIYSLKGNYDKAKVLLEIATTNSSLLRGRRIKAVALHELGSLSLYNYDHINALRQYKKALRLCDYGRKRYHDEAASNLIGLATVHFATYQNHKAIKLSVKAIKRANKAGSVIIIISAERMLGAAYKSLGDYQKASTHLSNALNMSALIGEEVEKYRILLWKGWLALDTAAIELKEESKARPLFEEALELAKAYSDHYYITEALLSLGWTFLKEKNPDKASLYIDQAFKGMKYDAHPGIEVSFDAWQVALYFIQGEYQKAIESGLKTIQACVRHDIRSWHIRILIILGSIYWHKGDLDEANKLFMEALRVSRSISDRRYNLATSGIQMCKENINWVPQ